MSWKELLELCGKGLLVTIALCLGAAMVVGTIGTVALHFTPAVEEPVLCRGPELPK